MLDGRAKAIAAPGTDTSATGTATPSATDSVTVDTTTTANAESPATTQSFEFNTPAGVGEYRQIRVPLAELRNGSLKYNIVIQPGDMIVIPGPQTGEYYVGGHVNRPGVYVMTGRKITLKQAIVSAGMFDQVAVPERTEIIRRLPGNKEVYARVNLDRVFSGEDPEIYLKPNDVLNVGTSIWAPFVAAVRNAFRFTYGFGFIYDKNFNTDTRTNGR
jgi:polysaccharide export outer membrane protein